MTFLSSLIDLLWSFMSYAWMRYFFFPVVAMAFLATVPFVLRSFFRWR